MAKLIKITDTVLDDVRKEFEEMLSKAKFSDGKITFTKTFGSIPSRKATIIFSELAWLKMQALIRDYSTEIGWHGTATRGENDTYIISDIFVYPQVVAAATVTTDQNDYQMWLMNQDDEVFDNIRMQGHSHVNMGTTPSAVDNTLYDGILSQLKPDMFYIFMIWNKKGEKTIKIYDMEKNVLFETSDCTVEVRDDGIGIKSFLDEAAASVKTAPATTYKPATTPQAYNSPPSYYGAGYYGGYGQGSYNQPANSYQKPQTNSQVVQVQNNKPSTKPETTSASKGVTGATAKKDKDGKYYSKKNGSKQKGKWYNLFNGYDYDDDSTDMYNRWGM